MGPNKDACMQRCSTLIHPINLLQHHPYRLVSADILPFGQRVLVPDGDPGKLGAKCNNEVAPSAKEACNGKDDTCDGKTDEGCKPTNVAVTFSSAYVAGKSGTGPKAVNVQMMVGPSGPVGTAVGKKHKIEFGFLAWLMALLK